MSNKIFNGIWIVAVSVFLASLVFILGISYYYFTALQKNQLKNETELASQGVAISGESYFENLNTEGYRITWISTDGSVLYDNEADTATMENHLKREEVKRALKYGYGEAARYSSTLSEKQLYDEINYRRSEKLTKKMLAAGLITPDECDKILAEIRKIFVPILAEIW